MWGKVALLALFNITGWNGLLLFGVQQLPAGRSAILAFTMPVWSVLISLALLHEPLSRGKIAGLALGMLGMGLLLFDDIRNLQRAPVAALLILGASISWAMGIVLVRKWKLPLSQTVVTGWMMLLGWVPVAILAPLFSNRSAAQPFRRDVVRDPLQHLPCRHARALGVLHAGAHAAGRRVVDVLAAGADRGRVRRNAAPGRAPGAGRVGGIGSGRGGDDRRAPDAEANARSARAG